MGVKVKICGITNSRDAEKAIKLGAWALGFVFYPKSPRYIEPKQVNKIISNLPAGITTVGVFVNNSAKELLKIKEESGIQILQLHGDESPEIVQELPGEVIKALRIKTLEDLELPLDFGENITFLIDAPNAGEKYGGTGELSDWELAKKLKEKGRVILSGGLGPENIKNAYEKVKPFAMDLSSGVEIRPGIKDHQKLETLFSEVNQISTSKEDV